MYSLSIALSLAAVFAVVAGQGYWLSQDNKMAGSLGMITCDTQNVAFSVDVRAAIAMAISDPNLASKAVVHKVYAGNGANNKNCQAVNAGGLFSLSIPYVECGTAQSTEDDKFVYRNNLTIIVRTKIGMFHDDTTFRQKIICSADTSLNITHRTPISPAEIVELDNPLHENFNIPIVNNHFSSLNKVTGFSVEKQVVTLNFALVENDRLSFNMLVDNCHLTSEESADSATKVPIIQSRGCVTELAKEIANITISDTTQTVEFIALKREDESTELYVHCQVNVCKKAGFQDRCTPDCNYSPNRDLGRANEETFQGKLFNNIKVKLDKKHTATLVTGANGKPTIVI